MQKELSQAGLPAATHPHPPTKPACPHRQMVLKKTCWGGTAMPDVLWCVHVRTPTKLRRPHAASRHSPPAHPAAGIMLQGETQHTLQYTRCPAISGALPLSLKPEARYGPQQQCCCWALAALNTPARPAHTTKPQETNRTHDGPLAAGCSTQGACSALSQHTYATHGTPAWSLGIVLCCVHQGRSSTARLS